jgi:hypothetical protein
MGVHKLYQSGRWFAVFAVLFSAILTGALVVAQDDDDPDEDFVPAAIEITATVNSIDGSIIVVGGLPVDITTASIDADLTIGVVVTVSGVINEEGIIIAEVILFIGDPTPTPEATEAPQPEATSTPIPPENVIIIEGPVENINVNIISIYNISITVAPDNPVLNLVRIGDIIRVEGVSGVDGTINAVVINTVITSDNVDPDASVSVQGPIESINGNIIVVNGITVQLDPDDPQLDELEVGNFIDVQGNFVVVNNTYVLVVVNVVIINNTYVGVPPYCHWHGMGGMGHWHCDGYWLYPTGYWYCEWRGMGMGMGMGGMGMGMGN